MAGFRQGLALGQLLVQCVQRLQAPGVVGPALATAPLYQFSQTFQRKRQVQTRCLQGRVGLQGAAHCVGAGFQARPQAIGSGPWVQLVHFTLQIADAHQGRQIVCHARLAGPFGHRFQRGAHLALAQPGHRPKGFFSLGPFALQLRCAQLRHAGAVWHRQALAQLLHLFYTLQAALQFVHHRCGPGRAQPGVQALALLQPFHGLNQALLQLRRPCGRHLCRCFLVLCQKLHARLQGTAHLPAVWQGAETPWLPCRLGQRRSQRAQCGTRLPVQRRPPGLQLLAQLQRSGGKAVAGGLQSLSSAHGFLLPAHRPVGGVDAGQRARCQMLGTHRAGVGAQAPGQFVQLRQRGLVVGAW